MNAATAAVFGISTSEFLLDREMGGGRVSSLPGPGNAMLSRPQAEFIDRSECVNCGSPHFRELSRGLFNEEPVSGFIASDAWGENPAAFLETAYWVLVQCQECSQVFHKRILSEEWNERRFTQWMSEDAIREFGRRLGPAVERRSLAAVEHVSHILRIERLTRAIRSSNEAVAILDFGCGFGDFLEACKHFGFDVCGIDRSVGRRAGAALDIIPSIDDIEPGRKFHVITLFEVLEHLDQPSNVLARLAGYLPKGGLLILETPDCTGVTGIKSLYEYRKVDPLEHINAFTHGTLRSIAERRGFKLVKRGPAYVTGSTQRAMKRFAKHLLRRDGRSTQLYFEKV